jgi:hypothetical protein
MATGPYFVFGLATVLSLLGFMRGPDPTPATPAEDWRSAKVDLIIPALDEEDHVVVCLTSVLRQTLRGWRCPWREAHSATTVRGHSDSVGGFQPCDMSRRRFPRRSA